MQLTSFIPKRKRRPLYTAGYPWFKCRARDQFIALPGLTLNIEEQDYFELVMKTAERGLREFMNNEPLTVDIEGIEQPDVPLWGIWAIQQYAKEAGKDNCIKTLCRFVVRLNELYRKRTTPQSIFGNKWTAVYRW